MNGDCRKSLFGAQTAKRVCIAKMTGDVMTSAGGVATFRVARNPALSCLGAVCRADVTADVSKLDEKRAMSLSEKWCKG